MLSFPYLDEPVGRPMPSLPAGAVVRWRPYVPVTLSGPGGDVSFSRALLDTGFFLPVSQPQDALHARATAWAKLVTEPVLATGAVLAVLIAGGVAAYHGRGEEPEPASVIALAPISAPEARPGR